MSIMSGMREGIISKIIGLACGPISPGYHDSLARRSAFQHATLLTMREILGQTNDCSDNIKCYVQDPAYSDVDKSVLIGAGFTILENPEAFLELDDPTAQQPNSRVFMCTPCAGPTTGFGAWSSRDHSMG